MLQRQGRIVSISRRATAEKALVTEVLHIGDHDPSGQHLFLSLADDVTALIRDMALSGEALFTRLAVTPSRSKLLICQPRHQR